jgi:hypothetical protein
MLRIVVTAPGPGPAISPDAVVVEDDTFLVLGAEPVAAAEREAPERLLQRASEAEPEAPGTVIVREGPPLRFHAVVHELNLEPTWREEWIFTALVGVLREVERRGLRTLALPLLGTLHGTLAPFRAAQLLRAVLAHVGPGCLEVLWLVAPTGTGPEAFDALREFELELRV